MFLWGRRRPTSPQGRRSRLPVRSLPFGAEHAILCHVVKGKAGGRFDSLQVWVNFEEGRNTVASMALGPAAGRMLMAEEPSWGQSREEREPETEGKRKRSNGRTGETGLGPNRRSEKRMAPRSGRAITIYG